MSYWKNMFGIRSNEFIEGVIAGIEAFAYWKDGIQYVGTTGETLKNAIKEVKKELQQNKEA